MSYTGPGKVLSPPKGMMGMGPSGEFPLWACIRRSVRGAEGLTRYREKPFSKSESGWWGSTDDESDSDSDFYFGWIGWRGSMMLIKWDLDADLFVSF